MFASSNDGNLIALESAHGSVSVALLYRRQYRGFADILRG